MEYKFIKDFKTNLFGFPYSKKVGDVILGEPIPMGLRSAVQVNTKEGTVIIEDEYLTPISKVDSFGRPIIKNDLTNTKSNYTELPSESRLEIKEIKKDFQNGNFIVRKGTKIKGEILRPENSKPIFRWYNTDKNALDSAKKGALGVVLNQDIPLEYFEEKVSYSNSGLGSGLGLFYFVVIGGGLFLIYRVIKGIKK